MSGAHRVEIRLSWAQRGLILGSSVDEGIARRVSAIRGCDAWLHVWLTQDQIDDLADVPAEEARVCDDPERQRQLDRFCDRLEGLDGAEK